MSFVARRAALRALPRSRGFSTATGNSYREQQEAMVHHAAGAPFLLRVGTSGS